jgi:long-subunit acyl-CoA synthetase (AMP-forming)
MRELMADPTARSAQLEKDMTPITRHPDFIALITEAVKVSIEQQHWCIESLAEQSTDRTTCRVV